MNAWNPLSLLKAFSWPQSEQPLIQHRPMGSDADVEWLQDFLYFEDLANDIESTGRHHLLNPHGPTIEDKLRDDMSPAARRAIYSPWPTFNTLWSAS